MRKRIVSTAEAAPPGGPYSQAVVVDGLVFCAGVTPTQPDGSKVEGTFEVQARAALENLRLVAEAAGASLADAVRVGVYLRDSGNFQVMNQLFSEYFGSEPPARTTLPVDLPRGFAIEVDAVLCLPQ